MKLPTQEPADRPLTIALSYAEVAALANWHISQARKIPARLGKASMGLHRGMLFSSKREFDELHKVAKAQLEGHSIRAKGLMSLIPNK